MTAQHIFVGVVPYGSKAGDEVLIQVWDTDTATLATRPHDRATWGAPEELEPRSTE